MWIIICFYDKYERHKPEGRALTYLAYSNNNCNIGFNTAIAITIWIVLVYINELSFNTKSNSISDFNNVQHEEWSLIIKFATQHWLP